MSSTGDSALHDTENEGYRNFIPDLSSGNFTTLQTLDAQSYGAALKKGELRWLRAS
jgi:hypothetical protein